MLDIKYSISELKKQYGNEIIYVYQPELFSHFKDFFNPTNEDFLEKINGKGFFISRFVAEYNNNLLQPIPYIVLIDEHTNKIFVTHRIGGEKRLLDKFAFIGGHINNSDSEESNIIIEAALRELNEEVRYVPAEDEKLKFHGIIKDVDSETSEHIGFIFTLKVKSAQIKEKENLEGIWMSNDDAIKNVRFFESWGQVVLLGEKVKIK